MLFYRKYIHTTEIIIQVLQSALLLWFIFSEYHNNNTHPHYNDDDIAH